VVTLYTYLYTIKILHFTHTEYLCVFFGPQNQQQVFPHTATSCWYLQHIPRDYRIVNRNIYISQCNIISKGAAPWFRQVDFDVRLRLPAFEWRSFHQVIAVDKVVMKLGFLLELRFDSSNVSDEEPPASHSEGLGSNPGRSIWVLCCY